MIHNNIDNKIGIEWKDVQSLTPYARNSRTHSDEQVAQICASIKEFGWTNPILIDDESTIIAGHGRLLASQRLSLKEVPTITLTGLTEAQKRAYVIADNRLALNAGWDNDMLAIELKDLADEGFDLDLTGFDTKEIDALLAEADKVENGLTDEDAVPPEPEEATSVLGDVWLLGNHRVMCGDSTSIDAIDILTNKDTIDLILTDPPYGIGYAGSLKLGTEKFGWKQHSGGWDESRPDASVFNFLLSYCDNVIIWGGNYFTDLLPPTMGWLIWDKGQRNFSLADGEVAWTSFDNAMRIKTYARASANKEEKFHATQKPIEIVLWCLEYADRHSKNKVNYILDVFGGSGSTLIACEKTNRKARLMELDPKYVDVIVQRWQDFTGKKAIHEKTNKTYNEMSNGKTL